MDRVSVIIATAGEIFLQKTIDDILENATEDIEIIVFMDGYIHDPPLKKDKRVQVIHSEERIGIHKAINASVEISSGKYLMKCDAHCSFDKGFDKKLKADCKENWICIPRRYPLNSDTWERDSKTTDYLYISIPLEKPKNAGRFWERGFNGVRDEAP